MIYLVLVLAVVVLVGSFYLYQRIFGWDQRIVELDGKGNVVRAYKPHK